MQWSHALSTHAMEAIRRFHAKTIMLGGSPSAIFGAGATPQNGMGDIRMSKIQMMKADFAIKQRQALKKHTVVGKLLSK